MMEIWYSEKGKPYPENEPSYYNIKDFPQLIEIEKQWSEISEELKSFMQEKDRSFNSNNYQKINIEGGWKSLTFMFWGFDFSREFRKKCPIISKNFNQIEGMVSLSFSRLLPNSSIARHRGDTNAIARCHLGIEVSHGLPECGLRAGEEEKGWEEGKWVIFNDAKIHSAWNNTDKRRTVLIIDIIRPEFLPKKNSICARIISYQLINNNLGRKKAFPESSFFIKHILFPVLYYSMMLYRPLRNLTRKFL
ncbi:MAG TPA: aspartyl/asparaginyl beta-hydroxylase domain-containing protein [Bacteroidia bacterium]|jgi:aspartyl/asparaginyl beta-hydroxylase (cupin superfamily)|nr:aspartyl/asparaginyl beta-hydroxylase domain-containing protein [Bacteroidia bacterium]